MQFTDTQHRKQGPGPKLHINLNYEPSITQRISIRIWRNRAASDTGDI